VWLRTASSGPVLSLTTKIAGMPAIEVDQRITPDQLYDFYVRNGICEANYDKDTATRVLRFPQVIVAAWESGELVGLARATFDGLAAHVMEFSLDLRWQQQDHGNGSLVPSDPQGLGAAMGKRLLTELRTHGCDFVTGYIVAGIEEDFYRSLGFRENAGHLVYYIDQRPYV
jgi:hypothetical protein